MSFGEEFDKDSKEDPANLEFGMTKKISSEIPMKRTMTGAPSSFKSSNVLDPSLNESEGEAGVELPPSTAFVKKNSEVISPSK
mmetsp:Transcript_32489/g.31883  ORF Transcript_32489/g.31883 Transcript_32489/m.31883 type:complete len:83 (-) Transcript_32489:36-284(-)